MTDPSHEGRNDWNHPSLKILAKKIDEDPFLMKRL